MPDSRGRLDQIRSVAERVASSAGMELVDVELAGRTLRIFIDKPAGIKHADCELVSRQVSAVLDAEDLAPVNKSYVLEVSSPGLDRKLVKPDDYRRFNGQRVKIVTRQPLEKRRNFSGVLEGFENDRVRVRLEGDITVEIERANIERANLVPTW